ncbi:MAG: transcriptional regulator PpsR [Alphaproteobacteria bacterium]|nr:transcriptional regulator PpsR [Alphaproteobacteria bacterium]
MTAKHEFSAKFRDALTSSALRRVVPAAFDIILLLDRDGVVSDAEFLDESGMREWRARLQDRSWEETVTIESKPKIVDLLAAARKGAAPIWRQVNHTAGDGESIPVRYIALSLEKGHGGMIALGRDMRDTARMQQELVSAQQSIEREYIRLRHAETRYRALFQSSVEPLLLCDSVSLRIVDANPSVFRLLEMTAGQLVGRKLPSALDVADASKVGDLMAAVRHSGRPGSQAAVLTAPNGLAVDMSVSLIREGATGQFLIRLSQGAGADGLVNGRRRYGISEVLDVLPDGIVVTDRKGAVISANTGFLDLAQISSHDMAVGRPISRWLGRSDFDVNALLSNLMDHGVVRMFTSRITGELGVQEDVDISAARHTVGPETYLCFSIRSRGPQTRSDGADVLNDAKPVHEFTELVGRVPLKELVREATDIIEKRAIEAALEITGDNRASASELLGVSRQSLYAKLHRYGIGDLSGESNGKN